MKKTHEKTSLPAGRQGFALLIAVIFMSVMLAFGLALGSLSYKQQVLASSAIQSQYAFYAADAALECALYYDQKFDYFKYRPPNDPSVPAITCDGSPPISAIVTWAPDESRWVVFNRLSLDDDARCADITVYKPNGPGPNYIFSQGYDVPCDTVENPNGARLVARGVSVHY